MKTHDDLTHDLICELFHYDQTTGIFTRKVSPHGKFPVGSVAGCTEAQGYIVIRISGTIYKAHRLAWLYMNGVWPDEEVDHKNGVKADNSWANLRAASHGQNQMNSGIPKNNTSGFKGVSWARRQRRWCAAIRELGKTKHLGYFVDIEDAAEAYAQASKRIFGDFARVT